MSFGEVYSALQLGTVDAQTQTINNIYASKMFEVGKYFTKINMNFNTQPFIMSMQLWKSLTPEQQDIIERAALGATKAERAYHVKDTQTSYDRFVKGGGKVIELNKAELENGKMSAPRYIRTRSFPLLWRSSIEYKSSDNISVMVSA